MPTDRSLELPSREAVFAQRSEFIDTIRENFYRKFGAKVVTIGSMKRGDWDIFSDIDLWVSVPDEVADMFMNTRTNLFSDVGNDLIRWERPSFAPINGIHSIVLYDNDETIPTEVDYYISPSSMDGYYKSFINCSKSSTYEYEWAKGGDDMSAPARVDYASFVTLWAGKYWHRRIDREKQIKWAWSRFTEVAAEVGIPVDAEPKVDVEDLSTIVRCLHDSPATIHNEKRAGALTKIDETIRLIKNLESEGVEPEK